MDLNKSYTGTLTGSRTVSLREKGVDLNTFKDSLHAALYVSLREKGVDLNYLGDTGQCVRNVSLREKGVDLNSTTAPAVSNSAGLPS